jgi:hypothetical protein
MDKTNDDWFESTWRYREKLLYPAYLACQTDGSIITIPYVAFAQMGAEQVDPRWLHCGVVTFPPAPKRVGFTWMTSGLSNAWNDDRPDPVSTSGLGIELRLDGVSPEDWPKDVLLRLSALQLLIGAGRVSGARVLGDGDRVRVGPETFGKSSAMTSLLATKAAGFQLPSGSFDVIQLFAIADAEREFAAAHGVEALMRVLRQSTSYPISDVLVAASCSSIVVLLDRLSGNRARLATSSPPRPSNRTCSRSS